MIDIFGDFFAMSCAGAEVGVGTTGNKNRKPKKSVGLML